MVGTEVGSSLSSLSAAAAGGTKESGNLGWFSEAALAQRVKELVELPRCGSERSNWKRRRRQGGAGAIDGAVGEEGSGGGGVGSGEDVYVDGDGGDAGVWSDGGARCPPLGLIDCVEEALEQVTNVRREDGRVDFSLLYMSF